MKSKTKLPWNSFLLSDTESANDTDSTTDISENATEQKGTKALSSGLQPVRDIRCLTSPSEADILKRVVPENELEEIVHLMKQEQQVLLMKLKNYEDKISRYKIRIAILESKWELIKQKNVTFFKVIQYFKTRNWLQDSVLDLIEIVTNALLEEILKEGQTISNSTLDLVERFKRYDYLDEFIEILRVTTKTQIEFLKKQIHKNQNSISKADD